MSAPAKSSSPSPADRVGQLLSGRYMITKLLGEGGMGVVYLAEHTLMRKRFALKVLHADLAENEEAVARFEREAAAAGHVDHPNVVAATDFGKTEDGLLFLVLEFIDGTSLRDALQSGPFPPARAIHVGRQIGLALERAHAAGIVHRDLKPENVMLVNKEGDPDFVKVLDFGVARFDEVRPGGGANQPLTQIGTVMGTPEYMAPEQALGERATAVSDLYAVGVMLYELLTGLRPFDGDSTAILSMQIVAPVPPMATRAPNVSVPEPLESVVRRLLEKEQTARYANARELVDALDEAAAACGLSGPRAVASVRLPSAVAVAPSNPVIRAGSESDVLGLRPSHPEWGRASPDSSSAYAKTAMSSPAARVAEPAEVRVSSPDLVRVSSPHLGRGEAAPPGDPSVAWMRQTFTRLLGQLREMAKGPQRIYLIAAAAVPLFLVLLVVVVIVATRKPGSSRDGSGLVESGVAASAAVEAAPAAKVRAAATKGPAALEALAREFPGDVAVLRELAFAYDAAGRTSDALGVVRRMTDANAAVPREIVRVVVRAASKFETADDAFALLEGPLGADGVEALAELAESKESSETTRARAQKSLEKKSVRANASPALAFALDLSLASTCEGKREVLSRAGDQADARALPALRALKVTSGCGKRRRFDCWHCLRGDDSLDRAVRAAESRGR